MAKEKTVRVKKLREIKIDPAKNKTTERRKVKEIANDPTADVIERAVAIALLGASYAKD